MEAQFVVGKNGSGKSQYLKKYARDSSRHTLIICNTVHDRYKASKRIKKFSIRDTKSKPENIIKSSFLQLMNEGRHRLNAIAKTLEYCGYEPTLTFIINPHHDWLEHLKNPQSTRRDDASEFAADRDLHHLFLLAMDRNETKISIDIRELSASTLAQEQAVLWLNFEKRLKRQKLIKNIEVQITKKGHRDPIKLQDASSGELTLIASQVFILSQITERTLVLIDEPENSLHPQWQKDYVAKLADLIGYYDTEILIATHSPIVVSGAQSTEGVRCNFFHAQTNEFTTANDQTRSIEESLWEQFETVSPESRYVSEHIVSLLEKLESKKLSFEDVENSLNQMEEASYDQRQEKAIRAAVQLAKQINNEAETYE